MRDVPSQILVFGHGLMYEYNPRTSAPACLVARAEVVSVDLQGPSPWALLVSDTSRHTSIPLRGRFPGNVRPPRIRLG